MKLIAQLLLACGSLVAVSSANAAVAEWGFKVESAFTQATFSNGTSFHGSKKTLSWGTSASWFGEKSSLSVIDSPARGAVATYSGQTPPKEAPYLGYSTGLTHANNPVYNETLTSAVLTNFITLTPLSPAGSNLIQVLPFNISFTETTNQGHCPVGDNPCSDIFVLTGGLMNSSFQYDDNNDGIFDTYFVNIFPVSGGVLNILSDAACAAANASAGCLGFVTPENKKTTLKFGFTISTNPQQPNDPVDPVDPGQNVPEPGALALAGLGLAALALRRRQQH